MRALVLAVVFALGSVGCGSADDSSDGPSNAARETRIRDDVRHGTFEDMQLVAQSVDDLCAQAPKLEYDDESGWDPTEHGAAIDGMKVSWRWARSGYARIQGVIAPQFPDTVEQLDARYEDYSEATFDSVFSVYNWPGLHAVERILWANLIPTPVIEFESTLPGYVAASWPLSGQYAAFFQREMCGELQDDLGVLESQWAFGTLRVDLVFLELAVLVGRFRDQVVKSASGADDSRYSQRTLADLRDTLAGVKKTYEPYRDYLRSKSGGAKIDAAIRAGFDALGSTYEAVPGDVLPLPPATWNPQNPSADDLASPFGLLYQGMDTADLVDQLNRAADLLGFSDAGSE